MLHILFTSDYEIHGNGDGSPLELMVAPTQRMLDHFEPHGAKLTIMADVAEILKFKEYQEQTGRDDYHYAAIAAQLQDAIRRGHDVQLHLHASYFNARHEGGRWLQDWSEYDFAGLPPARLSEVVRVGRDFLTALLRPVDASYECLAFRAANWSMSPSRNVVRALVENGIQIDTSVFKYGRREGIVSFDYSNAHSHFAAWPVDENDICRRDDLGRLLEIPIYSERRWIGAFLTLNRIYRALVSRAHRFPGASGGLESGGHRSPQPAASRLRKLSLLTSRHAWKADFNQCTGRQLIGALRRASRQLESRDQQECFVLIGHSKLYTPANARSLEPFLRFVAEHPEDYRFAVFGGAGLRNAGITGSRQELAPRQAVDLLETPLR